MSLRQTPSLMQQLPTHACIWPENALHPLLTWKATGLRLFCDKGFWGPDPLTPVPCGLLGSSCGCHGSWNPENQPQECCLATAPGTGAPVLPCVHSPAVSVRDWGEEGPTSECSLCVEIFVKIILVQETVKPNSRDTK